MRATDCLRNLAIAAVAAVGLLLVVQPAAAQAGREPWVVPERRARRVNPVNADDASLRRGRELYRRECESCHGATGNNDGRNQGEADMRRSRRLTDPTLWNESDGSLFFKLGEGRDKMPGTWDVLTDTERWNLVNYVRTFAPRPGGRQ